MTDEEKKAIEEIKDRVNITKNAFHKLGIAGQVNMNVMLNDIEYLLTAYEKEKEKNKTLDNNYISKDKIRKKVIEIKNRPVKDEFITATQGKLNTIIEIESLLEKE